MIVVNIRRVAGSLKMTIDAAEFHAYLRSLGARDNGEVFNDNPALPTGRSIDRYSNNRLSAGYLLWIGPQSVELSNRPGSLAKLKAMAESIKEVAQEIIEAYRPIDVTIRVVAPKKPEPVTAPAQESTDAAL
jgi:hypothetical protein